MKKLIFVNGTMGVGKSAVCNELKKLLAPCAFLDGDWCWDLTPFTVTQETKELVLSNAAHLLRSFLNCTAAENVLFSWVMPRREIVDELLARIGAKTQFFLFTLTARPDTVRARLEGDVAAGRRTPDVIARALARRAGLIGHGQGGAGRGRALGRGVRRAVGRKRYDDDAHHRQTQRAGRHRGDHPRVPPANLGAQRRKHPPRGAAKASQLVFCGFPKMFHASCFLQYPRRGGRGVLRGRGKARRPKQ